MCCSTVACRRGVAMVASAVMDRESRAELLAHIGDYAGGRVPLVVPLTLFVHHIRRCGVPYLADQVYLRPHPVELMLRNHV